MMDMVKVLYVEDEPFLARIVQESLESRGFHVHLSGDGATALQDFDQFDPDICVLDVMLPHKDGFTLAAEIKKKNPLTPIIFLTAKVQTDDLLKGFESGGNDYLRKPFSMEELIVRINNLLKILSNNHGQGVGLPTLEKKELGSYVFDPVRYELHLDEQVRKLSHRENRLLQLLTNDPDKPVLRKDILLDIWGDDSFYNSRNLDVYISRMREYFSADPAVQIITIKGVGYHFRCS